MGCLTCLYGLTYEKCGNEPETSCLTPPEYWEARRAGVEDPPFAYRFYEEGDAFKRQRELELLGERNIVIGWKGEAEVNVKWTMIEAAKHLHEVACECGYLVKAECNTITCMLPHGMFYLRYCAGQLFQIDSALTGGEIWPG